MGVQLKKENDFDHDFEGLKSFDLFLITQGGKTF